MRGAFGFMMAVLSMSVGATPVGAADAQNGVATMLADSSKAWNRGDVDAFMKSYEDSPQTVYIGSKTIVHGYAAIRARYAAHYKPGQMGTLSISDLAVRPLGKDYAVATARWHLAREKSKGGDVGGLFSLVLHRHGDGWQIITDHTP